MLFMKGFPVRKKIALLTVVSAFVVGLAAVPSANAAYIYATLDYKATDLCRTAPDVLTYKLQMKVKFRRSGVPAPSKVRIGYQVLNADSKAVLKSGIFSLKRKNGYKGKTATISATAGTALTYHISGKFTVFGKSTKANFTYPDDVPTVEQMDANPSIFPNC